MIRLATSINRRKPVEMKNLSKGEHQLSFGKDWDVRYSIG